MDALGSLGINVPVLIAQIVNFAILLTILYVAAYKPVLRMLDRRSQRIKESMERAEAVKQETEKVKQEMRVELDEARKQGQAAIAQASQLGERLKAEAKQEAQKQAQALIARAQSEIQRERDEAIAELRKEFVELTILAAGKVINRSLDEASHKQLIEQVLEESAQLRES